MGYWASLFGGYGGRGGRDRNGGLGGLLMLIVAPIAASLIQLAISRSREYEQTRRARIPQKSLRAGARASEAGGLLQARSPLRTPSTAHLFIIAPLIAAEWVACSRPTRRPRNASAA